jgi:[glutamine synthetase] adenylyltransferase / [glutamine synthetase]-adenylyl-L-tyrosine phosphorylase
MRARMAGHKQPAGPLDVKLLRGGLVDLEFIVHFLQLREGAAFHPDLGQAIAALAAKGFVPATMCEAYETMSRMLITARLLSPDGQVPHVAARAVLAKACGFGEWEALLAALGKARRLVAAIWAELLGETLEIEE